MQLNYSVPNRALGILALIAYHCQLETLRYPSCGHRHCPACQHNANNDWLAAQQQKLLPVDYYLITFTLPYQLRAFVWRHQQWAYQALFQAARQTIDSFFSEINSLGCDQAKGVVA